MTPAQILNQIKTEIRKWRKHNIQKSYIYLIMCDGEPMSLHSAEQNWPQVCLDTISPYKHCWAVAALAENYSNTELKCCDTGITIPNKLNLVSNIIQFPRKELKLVHSNSNK